MSVHKDKSISVLEESTLAIVILCIGLIQIGEKLKNKNKHESS